MLSKDIASPEFWRDMAPGFHVEDSVSSAALTNDLPIGHTAADLAALGELMRAEGYVHLTCIPWTINLSQMADTVRRLDRAGLMPVFAFLYDEFWIPFYRLHGLLSAFLGGQYFLLPDFWIWNVDPARGDAGWRPHRDKGRISLLPDGMPRSVTVWIPVSRATTLNGCMYIVPIPGDPTYNTPEENEWRFDFPGIRALPAEAGDIFVWNQAVMHWGSRTSPRGGESRVSMAFEFQRADQAPFRSPLIPPVAFLDFKTRLRLIAKQVLQYTHMYPVDAATETAMRGILNSPA